MHPITPPPHQVSPPHATHLMLKAAVQLASTASESCQDAGRSLAIASDRDAVGAAICDEAKCRFGLGPVPAGFGVQRNDRRPDPAKLYAALSLAEAIGTETRLNRMLQPGALTVVAFRLEPHEIETALIRALCPGWSVADVHNDAGDRLKFIRTLQKLQASHLVADDLPLFVCASNPRDLPDMIMELNPLIIPDFQPNRNRVAWMIAWCYPRVGSHPKVMTIVEHYLPDDEHLCRLTGAQIIAAMRAPAAGKAIRTLTRLCRRKVATSDTPPLSSIVGLGEAKELAVQIVQDLRDWAKSKLSATEICRGILLHGAPGTGKTTLARALAAEAGIGFFTGSYAIWQRSGEGHIGTFLKAMHATFEAAANAAPSILFIDEVDAFGSRTGRDDHGSSYYARVISGLLEALDGITGRHGVVVIAACNHPERIDPAIIRAGRFDRHIQISLPSPSELAIILRQHLGAELPDADLTALAALAVGKTGADCAAALRMARTAARSTDRPFHENDLRSALLGDLAGFPDSLRWRIAVHEVGHFITAVALKLGQPLGIRLSSGHGVFVMDPHPVEPFAPALHAVRVKDMAGREAERLVLGNVSAGAGGAYDSDLGKVMRGLMCEELSWGLGATGPLWLEADPDPAKFFALPRSIQEQIRQRISAAEEQAQSILRVNRSLLIAMANQLVKRFAMSAEELAEYAAQVVMPSLPGSAASHAPDQNERLQMSVASE